MAQEIQDENEDTQILNITIENANANKQEEKNHQLQLAEHDQEHKFEESKNEGSQEINLQESKDIDDEEMSDVDECEECPDEKSYVNEDNHMNIELKVKTSAIRKKWKVPIASDV